MAENTQPPSSNGKKLLSVFVLIGLLLVVMAAIYYAATATKQSNEAQIALEETGVIEQAVLSDESLGQDEDEAQAIEESVSDNSSVNVDAEALSDSDLAAASQERIMGDPSAPIKITEHASLTCSHCAHFHEHTLPEFKKQYIDTGRAYLVFSDFPLNAPALHASMIARCIPDDAQYFAFLNDLFVEQADWAGDVSYVTYLKNKAQSYGVDDALFQRCIKDSNLQNSLISKMQAVQQQWNVNSTPSFVVNNQVVISGALGYEDLDRRIQDAMETMNGASSSSDNVAPISAEEDGSEPVDAQTEGE